MAMIVSMLERHMERIISENNNMVTIPEILDIWDRFKNDHKDGRPTLYITVRQLMNIEIYDDEAGNEVIKMAPYNQLDRQDKTYSMFTEPLWHSKMPYNISTFQIEPDSLYCTINLK